MSSIILCFVTKRRIIIDDVYLSIGYTMHGNGRFSDIIHLAIEHEGGHRKALLIIISLNIPGLIV